MTPGVLQSVLRSLADAASPTPDADLLRRFVASRCEAAFTELVKRHGRLVWAVCRHSLRCEAEAEDAFQATFLLLMRNAAQVRDGAKLSAWLHGVAYRVCSKARLAAKRRHLREAASAVGEHSADMPESAWDRALAAVHEEAAKLPETLRVPFVLCCLEGHGATEAAARLGWKLGTFSGRLTRAKDAILARLSARGLTAGVIAGLALAAPPASALAKAAALTQAGMLIPAAVLELTRGVIDMTTGMKWLAAAVLVCGVGVGWLSTAGAQAPKPTSEATVTEKIAMFYSQLADARRKDEPTAKTKLWEYDLVVVSDMDQTRFWKFLQDREDRGWEYIGTTVLKDGDRVMSWMFRRPRVRTRETKPVTLVAKALGLPGSPGAIERAVIEAEIQRLQARLDALKVVKTATISPEGLPMNAEEFAGMLMKIAARKFKDGYTIVVKDGSVAISGDDDVRKWAVALAEKLREK